MRRRKAELLLAQNLVAIAVLNAEAQRRRGSQRGAVQELHEKVIEEAWSLE
jgi:hypothetical protein